MAPDWHAHIVIDPHRLHGKPTVRDLRLSVTDVLEYLAAGMSIDDLIDEFPGLTRDDVLACFAWAAERVGHLADAS